MSAIAAVAFTAVMVALAVFQLALIAGAPLGHFVWGGADRVLPRGKRIGSVVSLGIVMNGISRSKPERYTMAPVCVVLTVLSLVVALG